MKNIQFNVGKCSRNAISLFIIFVLCFGICIVNITKSLATETQVNHQEFIDWLLAGQNDDIKVTEIGIINNPDDIQLIGHEIVGHTHLDELTVNTNNSDQAKDLNVTVLYEENIPDFLLRSVSQTACTNTNYRVIYKDSYDDQVLYACFHGVGKDTSYGGYIGNGGMVWAVCPGMTSGHILYHLSPEIWSIGRNGDGTNLRNGGGCYDFTDDSGNYSPVRFYGIDIYADKS